MSLLLVDTRLLIELDSESAAVGMNWTDGIALAGLQFSKCMQYSPMGMQRARILERVCDAFEARSNSQKGITKYVGRVRFGYTVLFSSG